MSMNGWQGGEFVPGQGGEFVPGQGGDYVAAQQQQQQVQEFVPGREFVPAGGGGGGGAAATSFRPQVAEFVPGGGGGSNSKRVGGGSGKGGGSMAPPAAPFVPKAQPFVPKVNTPEFTPTVPQPVLQQPPGLNPYAQIAGPAGLGLGLGGGNGVGEAVGGGGGAMLGGGGGMLTQQLGALGIQQQQDQQVGLGMEVKEVARKTYPSLLPHAVRQMQQSAAASAGQGQTYFVDEQLRMQLIQQHMAVEATFDEVHPDVPVEVDNYHTLCPIEPINTDGGASVFGFPSVVYKAFSLADGLPYVIRRIVGFRLTDSKSMACVDAWKKINHANIIKLREVYTTKDFHDHSVAFVYDYHPLAETLLTRHFGPAAQGFIPEPLLWSYIIQITSALRAVHANGIACRIVHPSKVLISGRNRIRLSSACVLDVLQYAEGQMSPAAISHYQQEDLLALGRLILALACSRLDAVTREAMPQSMQYIRSRYSEDVLLIIRYLLAPSPHGHLKNLNDLMPMIGSRFYTELESSSRQNITLEAELGKELQNGRLFRLMTKLQMVIDRPEHEQDPRWTDTGDRYLLKLLKSYVFYRADESGQAWTDLAHVVSTLNKLDAGTAEKVCLVSSDEKNIMIVSYKDLKQALSRAFDEL